MKLLITGAAGFIGSSCVDYFLGGGHQVIGVDNFSTGQRQFLEGALRHPQFHLVEGDLLQPDLLRSHLDSSVDWVIHLAANADVRHGLEHPERDLQQNTLVTWNVLEAMRRGGARQIAFSSTGSVYGESSQIPTPEDAPFPIQTSLYGASKLAAEGLIQAYVHGYGGRGVIFRFVSILGERYTHGHVFDFVRQLRQHPDTLHILGNGQQRKSYLAVADCVRAIAHVLRNNQRPAIEIFNLGTDEFVTVDESVQVICEEMKCTPQRTYGGGDRGWVGDNPFIFLDCAKIRSLGWLPRLSIREAVRQTVRYLQNNPWVFEARKEAL